MKIQFTCDHCGGTGERETGGYNRRVAQGLPIFCSRACGCAARSARPKAAKWHQARFTERPGATKVQCAVCQRAMWLPTSKIEMYRTCGGECADLLKTEAARSRTRPCDTCGKVFTPRGVQVTKGGGRYCSQACNKAFQEAGQRPEVWAERIVTMRAKRANGEWTVLRGTANPQWKGGAKACRIRRRDSGIEAAQTRKYRKNHPDKIREFAIRRKSRKGDALPYGTIPRIRAMQKNRCAICRVSLRKGDHLDHIMPLARGGRHEPGNLQLLCPTCNMRKSDRDPIAHMQSLGRLL